MSRFILKRCWQAFIAMFGAMTILFFVQRLTGDPTLVLAADGATAEDIALMRTKLGFDQPLYIQYFDYLKQLASFSLGMSYIQNVPVWDILVSRIPYTLKLASGSLLLSLGCGIPIGAAMALKRGTFLERMFQGLVFTGQSMPVFFSGILLILLFAVHLQWLPSSGAEDAGSLIMPAISLGLLTLATFARVTRTAVLDELGKDYVRTARSKGVGIRRIVWRHLARNSAIPVITVAALEITQLLAGAVVVETLFAWPGLGQLAMQSIESRDFPVVQAIVLLGALASVACNLTADILYGIVDPRIRHDGGSR